MPVSYLNVATRRSPEVDFHWVYVPEKRYPFYRVGIYSNAVRSMAPPGRGALYVELDDRGRYASAAQRDGLTREVLHGLVSAGVLESLDEVLFTEFRTLEYAYVVFDHHHEASTQLIHAWLRKNSIVPCGRYGEWTYNSMEDCILAGRNAAVSVEREAVRSLARSQASAGAHPPGLHGAFS